MNLLIALTIAVSTVWVYVDATRNKIGKIPGAGGSMNVSAGAWGTITFLLWIIGFPAYLIKRGDLIRAAQQNPVEVSARGLKIGVFSILGLFVVLGSLPNVGQTAESPQAATPMTADTQTAAAPASAPTDEDQSDFSVDGLKVKTASDGMRSVVGVAINNTDKHFNYAQVEINLYDKSGAQVGSTLDNINNMDPHGKWKFSAPITDESATSFKFKGVTAY